MSSQWVNKFAIMRDLSLAQGCLPVDVAGAVGAGERPPTSSVKEDTEEEFYRQWVGDGDFAAPDLGLIKDMLEMVKNHDAPPPNEDEDFQNVIQIRKLNPMVPEFIPKVSNKHFEDVAVTNIKKQKKRIPRNVAVQSLLQNIEASAAIEKQTPILKPKDLLTDSKVDKTIDSNMVPKIDPKAIETVVKWLQPNPVKTSSSTKKNETMPDWNWNPTSEKVVNWLQPKPVETSSSTKKNAPMLDCNWNPTSEKVVNWLQPNLVKTSSSTKKNETMPDWNPTSDKVVNWLQPKPVETSSPTKKNAPMLDWNPTSMFKKKNCIETVSKPVYEVKKASQFSLNKYVPSKTADEYYKKFVECSEMHRMVEENVWTKVERQMKEIDERRKAEAELFSLSLALCRDTNDTSVVSHTSDISDHTELDLVRLSQHRHLLPAPCAVCKYKNDRDNRDKQNNTQQENVDDPCNDLGNASNNTDIDSSNSENKSPNKRDNVDDPWWNWRDSEQDKKVDDNWRNKTLVTDAIDGGNIETAKEPCNWRAEIKNVNFKPFTDDDADDIDAWRFEILGSDGDDNGDNDNESKDITKKIDKIDDPEENEASWQNETHVEIVCNQIAKWRSLIIGKKKENDNNNNDKETDLVMSPQPLETMEMLSDSE